MNLSIKVMVLVPVEVEFFISGMRSLDSMPQIGPVTIPSRSRIEECVDIVETSLVDRNYIRYPILGTVGKYTILQRP